VFPHAGWQGIAWSELKFHFKDGVPFGIRQDDGQLRINPPRDTVLADDDDILIVAEDDSTIEFQPQPVAVTNAFPVVGGKVQAHVEQELIIGWSPNGETILREYAEYTLPGNRVVSMLLAQISEDLDIARVYDDLFQENGAEIYLKPLHLYFSQFPVKATFAELMRVAQNREEICFGVKLKALETVQEQNCGVKWIPPKDANYTLTRDDCLVVLAEGDT